MSSQTLINITRHNDTSVYWECNDNDVHSIIKVIDISMLIVYVPSSILNLCVIVFAVQLFHKTDSVSHAMIAAIATGDLMVTSLGGPLELTVRYNKTIGSWFLCRFIHFSNWLGLSVSGVCLGLLNVEKLVYFQWPLRYPNLVSERRVLLTVLTVWSMCFTFVSIVMFYPRIVQITPKSCDFENIKPFWYEIFLHIFCTLPLITSAILSLYLYRLTRRLRAQDTTECSRHKFRSTVFTFATTFWTAISLLPYRLFTISRLHFLDKSTIEGCPWTYTAWFMLYLLMLSPVINPVITASIYVPYRKKFINCLQLVLKRKNLYQNTRTSVSYRISKNKECIALNNDS